MPTCKLKITTFFSNLILSCTDIYQFTKYIRQPFFKISLLSDYIYHFSFVFWNNYSSPPVTALEGFTADEANAFVIFLALQEVHLVVTLLLEPRLPAPEVECKAMYCLMWCLYHVNKFGVVIHCCVVVIWLLNFKVKWILYEV